MIDPVTNGSKALHNVAVPPGSLCMRYLQQLSINMLQLSFTSNACQVERSPASLAAKSCSVQLRLLSRGETGRKGKVQLAVKQEVASMRFLMRRWHKSSLEAKCSTTPGTSLHTAEHAVVAKL